jgi:hypothetical protein
VQLVIAIPLVSLQFLLSIRINQKYVKGRMYKKVDLDGKVYVITGCNTGIGFETAKAIVAMNGVVIMACRSTDKANEARNAILAEVKCAPSKVCAIFVLFKDFWMLTFYLLFIRSLSSS